jgi:hypothetical protein
MRIRTKGSIKASIFTLCIFALFANFANAVESFETGTTILKVEEHGQCYVGDCTCVCLPWAPDEVGHQLGDEAISWLPEIGDNPEWDGEKIREEIITSRKTNIK